MSPSGILTDMGFYDRPYARESEPGFQLQTPQTAIAQIVALCAVAYLAELFFGQAFTNTFSLSADWWRRPWMFFQLVTYGFLHSPNDIGHILGNMIFLWMFGREIERRYGRTEFLTFFLLAVAFAGIGWSLLETTRSAPSQAINLVTGERFVQWPSMLGASGGISALVVLYAFNFPHRQVFFLFVIPMPMWLLAVLIVFWDVQGAISRSGGVAFTAHLAGALFGLVYYKFGWRPGRWLAGRLAGPLAITRRHRLRVHDPKPDTDLNEQVDRILAKIQQHGQASLTRSERKTLEEASRRYQQKRSQ